jgi:hypothetical protein
MTDQIPATVTFKCFVCGAKHEMPRFEHSPAAPPPGWLPHVLWMQDSDDGILRTVSLMTCSNPKCLIDLLEQKPKASDLWMTPTAQA